MSQTKQTTTTNQYDPGSKSAFDTMTPQMSSVLSSYMRNPFNNGQYRLGLGRSMASALTEGNNAARAVQSMFRTSGFAGGAGSPFLMAQRARIGRFASGLRANAQVGNIMNAFARQQWATQLASGYSPLQTGQTATQKTSGLGTWLPQVMGAGLSIAAAPFTGGTSLMGLPGAMGAAGGGGGDVSMTPFNQRMSGVNSGINWGELAQPPAQPYNPFAFSH